MGVPTAFIAAQRTLLLTGNTWISIIQDLSVCTFAMLDGAASSAGNQGVHASCNRNRHLLVTARY